MRALSNGLGLTDWRPVAGGSVLIPPGTPGRMFGGRMFGARYFGSAYFR